jgi:L-arabinose transport system ATP-binding protein
VEIAKALSRGAHVIAFDEPTSSLSAREIDRLMTIIGRLSDEGKVVLYVSHRMEEVFRICNAVTVFKDGRYVRTFDDMSALTHDQLVTCMVGRDIQDIYDYRPRERGDVALKVDGLLGPGLREPVSFAAHKGEILGLFGLVGRADRAVAPAQRAGTQQRRTVELCGEPLQLRSPRDAIAAGVLLCPEDRKKEGIIRCPASRRTSTSARAVPASFGWLLRDEWKPATPQIKAMKVKTPNAEQKSSSSPAAISRRPFWVAGCRCR